MTEGTAAADVKLVDVSIIIPAYNEEARLGPTLEAVLSFLGSGGRSHEVVVVDDGSSDGTPDIARQWQQRSPKLRLLRNEQNRGKGYSVRRGVGESRGEVILFADADNSTPIEQADALLARLEEGADVAIASRALPDSRLEVRQPLYRETMGKAFGALVRLITGLPFRDCQCGFKAFKREVAQRLFAKLSVERWAFDSELLYLAVKKYGYKVAEVPVRWINSPDTRVNALTDSWQMLRDLLRVRWRDLRGAYD
ncbi:MAG: dolichyl-phosphate beta-glucosyltransferase [Armatimonadota bacterium]